MCGVRGSCTIERVECFTANLKKMSWNKGSLRKDKIGRFSVRNWLLEHSFESLKERPGNGLTVVELSDATYLQLFTVFSLLGLSGKAGVP